MINTFIIHVTHLNYLYEQKLKIYKTEKYNDEFVKVWVNEDTGVIIKAFFAGMKFGQSIKSKSLKY